MENNIKPQRTRATVGEYFDFKEVLFYFFRKKDPNHKPNINLKMMHWTNKTSIIMFIFFLIVWIIRRIF